MARFIFLLCLAGFLLYYPAKESRAQENDQFPAITRLDTRDTIFRQYLADVETGRRLLFNRNSDRSALPAFLRVYSYTITQDDEFFRIAARCNIPHSAIASLNRIDNPESIPGTVLLPTVPGLFIPENPASNIERIFAASRNMDSGTVITVRKDSRSERFLFIPGADFNDTERIFFLNISFNIPLRNFRISSPFGLRQDPFSSQTHFHRGVDLAAPLGTEVFPAKSGRVAETGYDVVFGNYIIITHDNNWVSLYGHLSSISTSRGSAVTPSRSIGKVGSTGQSTGAHLHFELRKNGSALDPSRLLFR